MNSSDSAKARLRNLTERNQLRVEKSSAEEVQGLLASAGSFIADARRKENSEATRFNIAYEAAHAPALAALRANDLRPAQGPGHRAIVFNVLDATTTAPSSVCVPLGKAHDKRNKLTYDGLTTFSRTELSELIESVDALDKIVRDLLSQHRPDLLARS